VYFNVLNVLELVEHCDALALCTSIAEVRNEETDSHS
jgi:hypothetical protein